MSFIVVSGSGRIDIGGCSNSSLGSSYHGQDRDGSIKQLATLAGVSGTQSYAVLGAKSTPSVEWLCRVAEALAVHPSAFLQGLGLRARARAEQALARPPFPP